jgi:excisionase family DNA binding protein
MQETITENRERGLASVKEASAYLNLCVAKLYTLMKNKELQYLKIGKSRRIAWKELEQFIERCTVHPTRYEPSQN